MKRLSLATCLGLVAAVLIVILFRAALPRAEATGTLFSDDFESGSSQWTVVDGTWSVAPGSNGTNVYSQTNVTGFARSVISNTGASGWTDYAVQAKVQVTGNKYAKLIARYQDVNNYYFMALRLDNHKIEFKRMFDTGSVGMGSINAGITAGTWYTATFEVIGTMLRAYINGTPIFTVTDNIGAPPLTTGKIGLGTLDASAEFDDVVVTSLVPVYTLTVTNTGTGSGSVSSVPAGIDCGTTCTAGFDRGTVVMLTATPASGSSFVDWIGAGCTGAGSTCVVTMDTAKSVTAVFSSLSQPPLLIVSKNGTGSGSVMSEPAGIDCGATCLANFDPGTVVTLTATASPFSAFTGWSGAGCSGSGVCVVTMDTSKLVVATFTYLTYPLTVTKAGNGTGTVSSTPPGISCGVTCTASFGGVVTLTATADPVSSFAGWSGAGCSGVVPCVVTMDSPQTVTATFRTYYLYLPVVMSTIMPVTVPPLYVAPDGNDSNPGTIGQPFQSLSKAVALATAGQIVYMRGGTYYYSDTITMTQSGNFVNMYKVWASPGELPVLDFAGSPAGARGFLIAGNYWHLKGLEIKNAQDNAIKIEGNYNIIEQCVLHHNQDTGLQIGLGSTSTNPEGMIAAYNQVINCDSYRNFDAATNGSNADGFACKLHAGKGNVFQGCRSWENADDGWDLFDTDYAVLIENSWTWHNGDRLLFGNPSSWGGNGNGFKVGGNSNHAANVLKNCVAFDHKYGSGSTTKGFDQNHDLSGVTLYNNTAWDNMVNYSFAEQPNDGTHHVLKNNVGFNATSSNVNLSADTIHNNNNWNLAVIANVADFRSLAASLAAAPRPADGSLPNNDFARLVADSDLIDQGVDVGIPYLGLHPDLGAFECR